MIDGSRSKCRYVTTCEWDSTASYLSAEFTFKLEPQEGQRTGTWGQVNTHQQPIRLICGATNNSIHQKLKNKQDRISFLQLRTMREVYMTIIGQKYHKCSETATGSPLKVPHLVGSSKNMTGGLLTSSRAMASLFLWPPDRWDVLVLAQSSKPSAIRISRTWTHTHRPGVRTAARTSDIRAGSSREFKLTISLRAATFSCSFRLAETCRNNVHKTGSQRSQEILLKILWNTA